MLKLSRSTTAEATGFVASFSVGYVGSYIATLVAGAVALLTASVALAYLIWFIGLFLAGIAAYFVYARTASYITTKRIDRDFDKARGFVLGMFGRGAQPEEAEPVEAKRVVRKPSTRKPSHNQQVLAKMRRGVAV